VAALMLEQGVIALTSLKIEDPESVEALAEEEPPFLVRLPVRVRLACSLAQLMKVLGAMERVTPLIDVRALRLLTANPSPASGEGQTPQPPDAVGSSTPTQSAGSSQVPGRSLQGARQQAKGSGAEAERLEVELVIARYLVTEPSPEASTEEDHEASGQRGSGATRRSLGTTRPQASERGGASTQAGSRKVPRKEPAHAEE